MQDLTADINTSRPVEEGGSPVSPGFTVSRGNVAYKLADVTWLLRDIALKGVFNVSPGFSRSSFGSSISQLPTKMADIFIPHSETLVEMFSFRLSVISCD